MKCPACSVEYPHHKPGCYNKENERKIREARLREHRHQRERYKAIKTKNRERY